MCTRHHQIMESKRCNKCEGIKSNSSSRVNLIHSTFSSPALPNLKRNLTTSSMTSDRMGDGGPESGDRATDKNRHDMTSKVHGLMKREMIQGGSDFDGKSDEEDFSMMSSLQKDELQIRGYTSFTTKCLIRSIVIFGFVLVLGVGFGYFVTLSNTGRIVALEKEISLMKEAWKNQNCMGKDPLTPSGWVSGRSIWNLFGLWGSSRSAEASGSPVVDDDKNLDPGVGWYESVSTLFGLLSSGNTSDDNISGGGDSSHQT